MTANADIEKFTLLHPRIMEALEHLSNSEKAVQKHLIVGKVAGKMSLIYSIFPPENLTYNDVPARFTFAVEGYVTFELQLMVSFINQGFGAEDLVFGFLSHSQWEEMREKTGVKEIDGNARYVAVKYSITRRSGWIFISKELCEVIEAFKKEDLDKLHKFRSDGAGKPN